MCAIVTNYHSYRNRLGAVGAPADFRVEISLSPAHSGEGIRATAIIRDITDQKRAEEQLRVLQEMACTAAA